MANRQTTDPRQNDALYPAYLRLVGERCVVVGGGTVASRKVRKLVTCGADVLVISPSLTPELQSLVTAGRIRYTARTYQSGDLAGAKLVYAATNDHHVNAYVAADADALDIFANIADSPDACTLMVPAETSVGTLSVAVSTAGQNPRIAKRLTELLHSDIAEGTRTFQDAILNLMGTPTADETDGRG